jgi:4-methylaminobutanoate oxidase (formaldehyde-forming)
MAKPLPTQARVVIIGGGIVGCSVAYHLAKLGWKDVILLERKALTSGTTFAAAGLVGQLRATPALTRLAQYGTECYAKLEEETGQATGYRANGSILVARTVDRTHEYDRSIAMASKFGIEMSRISPEEAKRMWPLMATDDLEALYYMPGDGEASPVDLTQALAKGARMGGVAIFEETAVTDIKVENGRVTGVSTDRGEIQAEYVVNCAGMWGREVGAMVGLSIPLLGAEHMHMITVPIDGVKTGAPTVRDMDGYIYFREEVGAILMGGFEPDAKPWGMKGIPENFAFTELEEDWDQFSIFMDNALVRFPILETAEIRHLTVVPESFTPDTAYLLGEAPGVENFFMVCGMNSVGIASAGGAGRAVAEWMDQGYPTEDLWDVDIRRTFPWQRNVRYLHDRITEAVGNLYAHHYPYKQVKTSRNVRRSAFHGHLADMGACFGVVAGWERANWFAPKGVEPKYEYSWGRQNWFEHSAAEHMAIRENVGVYDLSSLAQFLVQGPDAEKVLQNICANDVAVPIGKVVYTQWLNERGGIEADLTVTRLAEDQFFVITAGACETRDFDWLTKNIPPEARAYATNVGSGYAMLGIMGPRSRDLMAKLTDADLSNEAFPFSTAQYIDVAFARPLAIRMSFVGELGWELYLPTEFATGVFEALTAAGEEFDLKQVGLHAVDSLRLEKAYRHWGSDIGPDDTPLEAGLGFAVKLNKGDFIGREALLRQKEAGLTRKLATFCLEDPEPLIYHDEPIYRNGELLSANTHGSYGHLIGGATGMGYLENPDGITNEWIMNAEYTINVEGKMVPAKVHLKPMYDPKSERVRA